MLHHLFARTDQQSAPIGAERVVLRHAREDDIEALARLELLDSRRLPTGDLVVAEADGELIAAAHTPSGRTISDPFRPTAGVVALLRTWSHAR